MGNCLTRNRSTRSAINAKQLTALTATARFKYLVRRQITITSTPTDDIEGNYVVRNATSAAEVHSTHMRASVSAGWRSALDDHEVYYATDQSGFFLGELNGKTIACASAIKYGEKYAFMSHYVVEKLYRGKGYGLLLTADALATLPPTMNYGSNAVLNMVSHYEKFMGFKNTWIGHKMLFEVSHCVSYFNRFEPTANVLIQPANQVDLDLLSAYDTTAFGAPHHLFLKALLNSPNSINLAATNPSGDIVGFVSGRRTILEEDGWNISPLFADDGLIARALLKNLYSKLAKEVSTRKITMMVIPSGINPEACALAEELNGTILYEFSRMYTRGALDIPKEMIFSSV